MPTAAEVNPAEKATTPRTPAGIDREIARLKAKRPELERQAAEATARAKDTERAQADCWIEGLTHEGHDFNDRLATLEAERQAANVAAAQVSKALARFDGHIRKLEAERAEMVRQAKVDERDALLPELRARAEELDGLFAGTAQKVGQFMELARRVSALSHDIAGGAGGAVTTKGIIARAVLTYLGPLCRPYLDMPAVALRFSEAVPKLAHRKEG